MHFSKGNSIWGSTRELVLRRGGFAELALFCGSKTHNQSQGLPWQQWQQPNAKTIHPALEKDFSKLFSFFFSFFLFHLFNLHLESSA